MTPAPAGTPATPARLAPSRIALALFAVLALYGIDLACLAAAPAAGFPFVPNFALPFDLMVFVPAVFYLLVVRRYRLSPLLVLPVIWLGGLVSLQFAAPGKPSLLAPLGLCAVGVELGIAAREVLRLVRRFRTAKASSDNPLDWFSDAFSALVRNERVARMDVIGAQYIAARRAHVFRTRSPHAPHQKVICAHERLQKVIKPIFHAFAPIASRASAAILSSTCASVICEQSTSTASSARHRGEAARWVSSSSRRISSSRTFSYGSFMPFWASSRCLRRARTSTDAVR